MPQTPPFHALHPGRPLTDAELVRAIRLDMEAELDAINLYEAHLQATSHPEAQAILRHVMDEEKEHQALFHELLQRLDPAQRAHGGEASRKYQLIVSGASHQEVESVGKPDGSGEASAGLTVGALRAR
ncbi:MAG: demethoxyubiquinone hydroxylase family protein [Myxococcota bacterium]